MKLLLATPADTISTTVEWVELLIDDGSIVIKPGHAPALFALQDNSTIIFRLSSGSEHTRVVRRGLASVERSGVTVIVDE